jgi:hypothetical protein
MFLSSYMWSCHTDYDEDVIFEEDEEEDERTFSPDKVHRVIVKSQNILSQTFF